MSSSNSGDRIVLRKNNPTHKNHPLHQSIEDLLAPLSNRARIYSLSCLSEHQTIIDSLQSAGYTATELCFRDYLSGPHNEISGNNLPLIEKAFDDVRYELVPMIVFSNPHLMDETDNTAETSALFIEFHKRGMAF